MENNEAQERSKACFKELNEVLKKHNCTLIVTQDLYFGQTVYVPGVSALPNAPQVVPTKEQKTKKN
jgi:hypothetical protein